MFVNVNRIRWWGITGCIGGDRMENASNAAR